MAMVSVSGLALATAISSCNVLRGKVGIADQQARHGRDHADRREVSHRIERQLGIERRVDRVAGEADQQRVAVRCRLGDSVGGEIATGAGPVLDHHRLSQRSRQRLRDRPRHSVGGAARRCADQELDRLRWVIVSANGGGWRQRRNCNQQHRGCEPRNVERLSNSTACQTWSATPRADHP